MTDYKIKNSFISLEGPNDQANKTGIDSIIFISKFVREKCMYSDAVMIFQYGQELVLIHQILNGFEEVWNILLNAENL